MSTHVQAMLMYIFLVETDFVFYKFILANDYNFRDLVKTTLLN